MNTEMNASHDAIEGKKGALVKDIKSVVGSADALVKDVASATTRGYSAARIKVEGKLIEARSRLDDARLVVAAKTRNAAGSTHAYVRENPWRVLGVAAATGIVLGFLLSRR